MDNEIAERSAVGGGAEDDGGVLGFGDRVVADHDVMRARVGEDRSVVHRVVVDDNPIGGGGGGFVVAAQWADADGAVGDFVARDIDIGAQMAFDGAFGVVVFVGGAAVEIGEIIFGDQHSFDAGHADDVFARAVGGGVGEIDVIGALAPDEIAAKAGGQGSGAMLDEQTGGGAVGVDGVVEI